MIELIGPFLPDVRFRTDQNRQVLHLVISRASRVVNLPMEALKVFQLPIALPASGS